MSYPRKPTLHVMPAHGSGFINFYDMQEVDAYIAGVCRVRDALKYEIERLRVRNQQSIRNPAFDPENLPPHDADEEAKAKTMRMFVWDGRGAYKISVCAENVSSARALALEEIGLRGTSEIAGSPMARAKDQVVNEQPLIYHRPNAELVVSVSGETEELNILLESESAAKNLVKAERDSLRLDLEDTEKNVRILSDACETWEKRFNGLRTANRWIPVSEGLPAEEGYYLTWNPYSLRAHVSKFWTAGAFSDGKMPAFSQAVTHWRKIEPPERRPE